MAVEPEFVRLMKRWTQPTATNVPAKVSSEPAPAQPIQLDDDETDLR